MENNTQITEQNESKGTSIKAIFLILLSAFVLVLQLFIYAGAGFSSVFDDEIHPRIFLTIFLPPFFNFAIFYRNESGKFGTRIFFILSVLASIWIVVNAFNNNIF